MKLELEKIKKYQFTNVTILSLTSALFMFQLVFPSIRILLVGSKESKSLLDYFVSSLPELLLLLVVFLTLTHFIRLNRPLNVSRLDKFVLVYVCVNVLIGAVVSPDLKVSLYGFRLTYLPVIFYFLVRYLKLEKEVLEIYVDRLFKTFVMVGLIGIIIYFFFFDFMVDMIHQAGGVLTEYYIPRMTSIFWTPVVFGTLMSVSFLYFFFKLLQRRSSHFDFIYLFIASFGTLFSISRGAVFVMIVGMLALPLFIRNWKVLGITFSIVLLQFVGMGLYIQSLYPDLDSFFVWTVQSYSDVATMKEGVSRTELWRSAIHDFQNRPFGYGLGNSGHVAVRFYPENTDLASVHSTDGWFLKMANETGFIGLTSYIGLAIVFVFGAIQSLRKNSTLLVGFALIMFILVNIQNLVSNVLDFYLFSNLFWMILGISENVKCSMNHD